MIAALLLLGACGGDDEPAWALQHATVSLDEDGTLSGFQTWELYADKWSRRLNEKHHLCAVVEQISGTPLDEPRCPGCVDGFTVFTEVADSDCPERWVTQLGLAEEIELLIGDTVDDEALPEEATAPRRGWYQRFGGGEAVTQGHIWSESGAPDALPMLVTEERYVLWPTSAWSLLEE